MSKRLAGLLGFSTHHRYAFALRAKLNQGCSKAAKATGISVVWRRLPITSVTIVLVTAIWIYDYLSVSSAADPAMPRSSVADELRLPKLPKPLPGSYLSNKGTETGRPQGARATLSAFRRIPVGQNEVDYIAEDVTIRLFTHRPKPTRVPHSNKQLHTGEDVTARYFGHEPAPLPQTRRDSATAQSVEPSLLVSK